MSMSGVTSEMNQHDVCLPSAQKHLGIVKEPMNCFEIDLQFTRAGI